MKLKNIFFLSLSVAATSCDFLEEDPITRLSGDDIFNTESSLETCMNGVYSSLSVFGSGYVDNYLTNASQLAIFRGTRTSLDYTQLKWMTFFSETSTTKGLYSGLYSGVQNCNNLLYGIQSSPVDPEYLREVAAEARFLRAYFYFGLVRAYGSVPLITEKVLDESQVNIPRTPYQEVYAQILDDLTYAEKNMRTRERQAAIYPTNNRACREAATAVKAQVYGQIACLMESPYDQFFDVTKLGRYPDFSSIGLKTSADAWNACLKCCEELIQGNVYDLEEDYRNLFAWDPKDSTQALTTYFSKERIFVIANSPSTGRGIAATWCNWNNPAGTEATDSDLTNGNAGRIRPSFFMWEKWCKAHGGIPVTDANGVTYYPDCPDPRLNVSYAYKDVPKYTTLGGPTTFNTYPVSIHSNFEGDNAPYFRKYISSTFKADQGDADQYLIRMADIYLQAAEAAASLSSGKGDGNWGKALKYTNKVLARARASADSTVIYPKDFTTEDFSDRQALVDAIVWEQLFETSGEFHEWFYTHKRGATWLKRNISDPCYEYYSRPECAKVVKQAFRGDISCFQRDVEGLRSSLLIAFPAEELRRNTVLDEVADQNDFYIR